jgi:Immunity protein 35
MSPPDDSFVIIENRTTERSFGWIFFCNSRKFLETGLPRYRLAGNGPIIVNKIDGTVRLCGAGQSLEEVIRDYENTKDLK